MKKIIAAVSLLFATAAQAELDTSSVKLHRQTASHHAWNTNTYFIESPSGVVLIDAQLLASDAKMLAAMIKATGKPLKGVFITHPHLDHFGGLPELKAQLGDFPIYATKDTAAHMKETHTQMHQFFKVPNRFGEALDDRFEPATHIVAGGETITVAGIDLKVHDLGAGEAQNNIIVYQKDLNLVFAGDTFYPHGHYYIGEGHIDGARNHLQFILDNFAPDTAVLGGHNDPARAQQAAEQIAYIDHIEKLTAAAMAVKTNLTEAGNLKNESRAAVVALILERYPNFDDFFYKPAEFLPGSVYATENHLKRKNTEGK